MGMEADFARLIDSAPHVQCVRCNVEMTLRTLVPVQNSKKYTATFRSPKYGSDTDREFAVSFEPLGAK